MRKRMKNPDVEKVTDKIIEILHKEGFVIQRYDSMTTSSIYLKLDYGVCNSLRVSDHQGKPEYCYRYNLILGGETNIVEEKFIRYYFNEKTLKQLLQQILFDKKCKLEKYGMRNYQNFMQKNQNNNDGKKGFWSNAKLLNNPEKISISLQMPKSRPNSANITLKQAIMPDGTVAYGPQVALDTFANVIQQKQTLSNNSMYHIGETINVTADFDTLVNFFKQTENDHDAITQALLITGRPGYNVGEILGVDDFDDIGKCYTVELPMIPLCILPEKFIGR